MVLSAEDVYAITAFFQYVDTDKDGFISVEEIRQACKVDIDGDGAITEDEIVKGAAPWVAAFAAQDLDGDIKLSLSELLAYNEAP